MAGVSQSLLPPGAQASDLEDLRNATSLYREGLQPWELKLDFKLNDLNGKPQDAGSVLVTWRAASDKPKIKLERELIHGRLGDISTYNDAKVLREIYLIRELIDETVNPIASLPQSDFEVKEQTRSFGHVELRCLALVPRTLPKPGPGAGNPPTFCVEPNAPHNLRVKLNGAQGSQRNRVGRFQNASLTLDNTIIYGNVIAIEGKSESLRIMPQESSAASEAEVEEVLSPSPVPEVVVAGHRISGARVEYPAMARLQHLSGSAVLFGFIDTSGHVKRLVPIASPSPLLTDAAISADKTYVFEPYLLNGKPVEVETTLTTNFNLRP